MMDIFRRWLVPLLGWNVRGWNVGGWNVGDWWGGGVD
jgi:hypothetical protein